MKIAVISDTHSRVSSVLAALEIMSQRGVEAILHCGDIQDAGTVRLFPAHTHFVFGNCDYSRREIEEAAREVGATIHGDWGKLDFAGQSLALIHSDDRAMFEALQHADAFDFLFYGHTHVAKEHRVGRTRVINPGAIQRVAVRTFIIIDLPSGEVETIEVA
jgi:putative phosphoesterase